MKINEILKERREKLGVGQTELAHHCGFADKTQVSHIENGRRQWTFDNAVKAAELLGLHITISDKPNKRLLMKSLASEITMEWINVIRFLNLDTDASDLTLDKSEHCISGSFNLNNEKIELPKFKPGDNVRKIMTRALSQL